MFAYTSTLPIYCYILYNTKLGNIVFLGTKYLQKQNPNNGMSLSFIIKLQNEIIAFIFLYALYSNKLNNKMHKLYGSYKTLVIHNYICT